MVSLGLKSHIKETTIEKFVYNVTVAHTQNIQNMQRKSKEKL